MEPKFISLPNGTVINIATVVSVTAFLDRSVGAPASVAVVYKPAPSHSVTAQVDCATDEEAVGLRDRIIARLNEHSPIISV
jgi:hypothetical protein